MTYPTYSQQQLHHKSIAQLKQIYNQIGASVEVSDKRCKASWVSAIAEYQSSKIQKLTPAAPDNQAISQTELDHHITTQAQTVAPEKLTPVEISFYDHEYYAGNKLIAAITHDDNLTQPWVVIVNKKEVHRAATVMLCHRYICTHYKDGSLPVQEEAGGQGAGSRGERFSPLHPAPCSLSSSTTGNEIMAQIFNECEKYGFEILDDGIYQNDVKLGEVGCTDGGWWVMRAVGGNTEGVACQSALEAVWWLAVAQTSPHTKTADCEQLLDRPFDELTPYEWQQLREYAPVAESRELVAA